MRQHLGLFLTASVLAMVASPVAAQPLLTIRWALASDGGPQQAHMHEAAGNATLTGRCSHIGGPDRAVDTSSSVRCQEGYDCRNICRTGKAALT